MTQEQLFASFVLDRQQELEIALKAEHVSEATHIQGSIQKLPGAIPFVEGIMHLRDDVIPIINLKKRLGLNEQGYLPDAKVAVVSLSEHRFGLLFDDIKEVFRAEPSIIAPISKTLQSDDKIISALIKLDSGRRAVELLDLKKLFAEDLTALTDSAQPGRHAQSSRPATAYSRYVVFSCGTQEYGVSVDCSREITFCTDINEMFKTDIIEGALELRGVTIPVINARTLLGSNGQRSGNDEATRVLVLASEDCSLGLIVDEVKEIITIADDAVLPFPSSDTRSVKGMFQRSEQQNIILVDMEHLVCDQIDSIKSMARIGARETGNKAAVAQEVTHHLITENCYLIFSIGKNFAIELKDVQEIIENTHVMTVPGSSGYSTGVINLRGRVVPVVNLRKFYHYPERKDSAQNKLIICAGHGQQVALEVDQIITIYKQEKYHATPSLNAQLNDKKDTVDRLIEYLDSEHLKEHVLVVNSANLISNHLHLLPKEQQQDTDHKTDATKNTRNKG